MPEDKTQDNPDGQGSNAPAGPGADAPPTPGEAGQGGDKGSWSKEVQGIVTNALQKQSEGFRSELQEERNRWKLEAAAEMEQRFKGHADMQGNRDEPPPELPDGIDLGLMDKVYRQTSAFQEQQRLLQATQHQLREQSIAGELRSVAGRPLFDQFRSQIEQQLRYTDQIPAGCGEIAYKCLAHDVIVNDSNAKATELDTLREEKRQQLEQANAVSSGGVASGGYEALSPKDQADVGARLSEDMGRMDNDAFRTAINEMGKSGS